MTIILTAPHSRCPQHATSRKCDKASKRASLKLEQAITTAIKSKPYYKLKTRRARPAPKMHRLLADTYRDDWDLNSDISYMTKYRKQLRHLLPYCTILLDIHSFPEASPDIILYRVNPKISPMSQRIDRLISKIINKLPKQIKYATQVGDFEQTSIIKEAILRYNTTSLMISFNENLSLYKIEQINKAISNAINNSRYLIKKVCSGRGKQVC